MKTPHKYSVGDTVYCRPWMVSGTGMIVYRCMVIEAAHFCAGTPYYTLKIIEGGRGDLFVRYELEIDNIPDELVKMAKIKIEENYGGYVSAFKNYNKALINILKSTK